MAEYIRFRNRLEDQRIEELLQLVELTEKRKEFTKNLSGGMKRRLEIARGLLVQPKVLFLDEPTIGLDTQTRKRIWSYIKKVNQQGVTVLLTTHYMDEADQNSDVICIIDRGKIIANGTPEELKKSLGQDCIQIQTDNDHKAYQLIQSMPEVSKIVGSEKGLSVHVKEKANVITKLIDTLRGQGIEISSINLVEPSLDDVFIHYTGRGFEASRENNTGGHSHGGSM